MNVFKVCIVGLCVSVATAHAGPPLEKLLATANPRLPGERELVADYGAGHPGAGNGNRTHTYYLPEARLWVRCTVNPDNRVELPVEEILVSRVPLGPKSATPKRTIGEPELKGIRVGNPLSKVIGLWGKPLGRSKAKLGDREAEVYEFLPGRKAEGVLLRVLVLEKAVAAFALVVSD